MEQTENEKDGNTPEERKLIDLIKTLVQSDLEFLGRPLLRVLRWIWFNRKIEPEAMIKAAVPLPEGPFLTTRKKQMGDLLLWAPRHINSYLIDDLTGGYGYSHTTADTGEIDAPTGKPVMAEVTVGEVVSRKFQDQFGDRAYVRIPLSRAGVNTEQFVECVKAMLGQPYDNWEALTLGEIQDPAKQVCTGIATECLPERMRARIAWARRLGLLHRASVSVHSRPIDVKTREFISPNGFAEFFGAPKGKELGGPDITIKPRPINVDLKNTALAARRHYWWVAVLGGGTAAAAVYLWWRNRQRPPRSWARETIDRVFGIAART